MPRQHFGPGARFLPKKEILTFEEITELAEIFVELGVGKFRLTGGEPLLRNELPTLVRHLSSLRGARTALTTNGALLAQHAEALKQAGLGRVTVSLDALDEELFRAVNDVDVSVETVLAGIREAERVGFSPIKINTVLRRGINDRALMDLVRYFRGSGHILRFIELMDVGSTNRWQHQEVVSAAEVLERIGADYPLEPLAPNVAGEVAERYRYQDGQGEIGVIASVTRPFCGGCTRARLSADGRLFLCLFASDGVSLRDPLRSGASRQELRAFITHTWQSREDRYSELRALSTRRHLPVEMSFIGG
jgi:cyclic pyranopterin phosphate synthase